MSSERAGHNPVALWPEEIQRLVRQVLDLHEEGRIAAETTDRIVRGLVAGHGDGRLWTVGQQTGAFYQWEGSGWERGEPAGRLLLLADGVSADACGKCGASLRPGARFCTPCGAGV